jgi:hypothetical protein
MNGRTTSGGFDGEGTLTGRIRVTLGITINNLLHTRSK